MPAISKMEGAFLPHYDLRTHHGERFRLDSYRQRKNLILCFFHAEGCDHCRALLTELAARHEELKELDTEIVGISPAGQQELSQLASELKLPYLLLSDPDLAIARRFNIDGNAAILIADRFCELRWQAPAGSEHELPEIDAIVSSIEAIEIECPECGVWGPDEKAETKPPAEGRSRPS